MSGVNLDVIPESPPESSRAPVSPGGSPARRTFEKQSAAMSINSQKNKNKQKMLAHMDEKRRKEEVAEKRRKEREAREEEQRKLQAEKAAEEARQ